MGRTGVLTLGVFLSASLLAEGLDPYQRWDDLSLTDISVSVSRNAAGHYEYAYRVSSPPENTGRISNLIMDLSCDKWPDDRGFDRSDYPAYRWHNKASVPHVPLALKEDEGLPPSLSVQGEGAWLLSLKPGDAIEGLGIVSPYGPGMRRYQLLAAPSHRGEAYDYSGVDWVTAQDDGLPYAEDWAVHGLIQGPACPGSGTAGRFEGFRGADECPGYNDLMVYAGLERNQFHVERGATSFPLEVHYSEAIDATSFSASHSGKDIGSLFLPRPGVSETVLLPLDEGVNRFTLEVGGSGPANARADCPRPGIDRDFFVIRRPAADGDRE